MIRLIGKGALAFGILFSLSVRAEAVAFLVPASAGIAVSAVDSDKVLESEALELAAGMGVAEWKAVYKPLRDLAKAADKESRLKDAADLWVRAAYQNRTPTYRAAALRNAAFFSARIGECERAKRLWAKARALLNMIEEFPNKFPTTEKMQTSGKKTAADINWGFEDSACRNR